jgi:hypothetical protein
MEAYECKEEIEVRIATSKNRQHNRKVQHQQQRK